MTDYIDPAFGVTLAAIAWAVYGVIKWQETRR